VITQSHLVATIQDDRRRSATSARLARSVRHQAAVEACRGSRSATIHQRVAMRLGYVPAGC
jgi:hypothetical protein